MASSSTVVAMPNGANPVVSRDVWIASIHGGIGVGISVPVTVHVGAQPLWPSHRAVPDSVVKDINSTISVPSYPASKPVLRAPSLCRCNRPSPPPMTPFVGRRRISVEPKIKVSDQDAIIFRRKIGGSETNGIMSVVITRLKEWVTVA